MKAIVCALLAVMMISTAMGDSGTPQWIGVWKVWYDSTYVYLVILADLSGYVAPYAQGDPVVSVAELTGGQVSGDGTTYTATWTATSNSGTSDICAFKLTKINDNPTGFKGTVTWPDGFSSPFDGEWVGPVQEP